MMMLKDWISDIEKNRKCYLESLYEVIEKYISDEHADEDEELVSMQEKKTMLKELAEKMCEENTQWIGKADQIHNIAVEYARQGYQDLSCEILLKGLRMKKYAANIDLLADFLQYSIFLDYVQEDTDRYFCRICKIPKKMWNWRAFEFSINYMLARLEYEDDKKQYDTILENCMIFAEEYVNYLGESGDADRAYYTLATVHKKCGNEKKQLELLEYAKESLKKAPMCALAYADIQFSKGFYDETKDALMYCIRTSVDCESNVNVGYPHILLGLCQIAICFSKENRSEEEKTLIKAIDREYELAKLLVGERNKQVIGLKQQINVLKKARGITMDFEDNE